MAIEKMPTSCVLSMKVQTGLSGTGAPVYRFRNYGKVKPAASDDSIYSVAVNLGTLQEHTLVSVTRQDNSALVDMG